MRDRPPSGGAPREAHAGPPAQTAEPACHRIGVSRRGFIQTIGLSAAAGAVSARLDRALAQDAAPAQGQFIGPGPTRITLSVNGRAMEAVIEPADTLLDVLRQRLDLTGTKVVCDRGACGGCSALVNGKLVNTCMMLAMDAVGAEITTIEGLAQGDALDPVQAAFIKHDALQCGFCTPGLVVAARALLNANPRPSLAEIKRGLSGNICRCGTYTNVFNAVLEASGQTPIRDGEEA